MPRKESVSVCACLCVHVWARYVLVGVRRIEAPVLDGVGVWEGKSLRLCGLGGINGLWGIGMVVSYGKVYLGWARWAQRLVWFSC